LDRLGRSVKEVLTIADGLHDQGVGLRILTGTLTGTYSPTGEGKFFFVMMAAFAELERDMIRERTMAGLAAARAQGRTGGRPTVMDADTLAAAQARRANGESPTQIAKALGVSRASIYRHLPTSNT
jgi:DNA invertase Pin-like site-specific DNA recombinase